MKKCLICFEDLSNLDSSEYHKKCSEKLFGHKNEPELNLNLFDLKTWGLDVVKNKLAIPGVQQKLSLAFEAADKKENRLTVVGFMKGLFILKPPTVNYTELPENEATVMNLAEICEIKTAAHGLIRFKSGELGYITKRFDRVSVENKLHKLPQEDMCQLLEQLTEDKYSGSMEKVAKCVLTTTEHSILNSTQLFETTLFNYLIGNSDMHLKNFSLLKNQLNQWELSPAYDLLSTVLVLKEDLEEIALTLNGKKNKLTLKDFKVFAQYCQINDKAFNNILKRFQDYIPKMGTKIQKSFLSVDKQKELNGIIEQRSERLGLLKI